MPYHQISKIWDAIKLILLLISIIWVTLYIGFNIIKNDITEIVENIGLTFLAFDIIIQMNKSYFD